MAVEAERTLLEVGHLSYPGARATLTTPAVRWTAGWGEPGSGQVLCACSFAQSRVLPEPAKTGAPRPRPPSPS